MFNLLKTILNKKKYGNTMAETLIAMTIVGIVFTLTVGVMIADYNRNQTVIRLEKMYSTLGQAFDKAMVQNGAPSNWDIPDGISEENSTNFFTTYLEPNLVLSKVCKGSTTGECNYDFKELDGTPKELNHSWSRFFLNDGAFIALQTVGNNNYKVVYFYVDTNGKKRLNVVARDIFLMEYWIQNDAHPEYVGKLRMFGEEYPRRELISENNNNNCNSSKNGNYCGALIKADNWQIKQGYPWAQARYVVQ